jgi:hypothetical protein
MTGAMASTTRALRGGSKAQGRAGQAFTLAHYQYDFLKLVPRRNESSLPAIESRS